MNDHHDFSKWNQDQLDQWCSRTDWKNQLDQILLSSLPLTQQKSFLNVILHGSGTLSDSLANTKWNNSTNAILVYKAIIQYDTDQNVRWGESLEVNVVVIEWIFHFIENPQLAFICRLTALSTISLLLKSRHLSNPVVEAIIQHLSVIYKQLVDVAPTYLTEQSNPLVLITSQLEEILQLLLLKYEAITTVSIGKDVAIMLQLVFLCLLGSNNTTQKETDMKNQHLNRQQERFVINVMTLFSMIAETDECSQGSSFIEILRHSFSAERCIELLRAIIDLTASKEVTIHNVYQSCFHYLLLYFLKAYSGFYTSFLSNINDQIYQPIVSIVAKMKCSKNDVMEDGKTELNLEDVLDLQVMELLIGFLASFYDAKSYGLLLLSHSNKDEEQKEDSRSFITNMVDSTVAAIMQLQANLKEKTKELSRKKGNVHKLKELKGCYSDIRKGCISCLESIFQQNIDWITNNPVRFWNLSVQSLMTPMLFPYGYHAASLTANNSDQHPSQKESMKQLQRKIFMHLFQAVKQIEQYSFTSIEDIFECIQQFITDRSCIELIFFIPDSSNSLSHSLPFLDQLSECLNKFPSKLERTCGTEYKWWILVLSLIQECVTLLHRNIISCSSVNEATLCSMSPFTLEQIQVSLLFLWRYFHSCSSKLLELIAKRSSASKIHPRVKMTYKTITKSEDHGKVEEDRSVEYEHSLISALITNSETILCCYRTVGQLSAPFPNINSVSPAVILWEDLFLYLQKRMRKLNSFYPANGSQPYEFEDEITERYLLTEVYTKFIILYGKHVQQYSLLHQWVIKQILFLCYYGQPQVATTLIVSSRATFSLRSFYKQQYQELLKLLEQDLSLHSSSCDNAARDKLDLLIDKLTTAMPHDQLPPVEERSEDVTTQVTLVEGIIQQFLPLSQDRFLTTATQKATEAVLMTRDELALKILQLLENIRKF